MIRGLISEPRSQFEGLQLESWRSSSVRSLKVSSRFLRVEKIDSISEILFRLSLFKRFQVGLPEKCFTLTHAFPKVKNSVLHPNCSQQSIESSVILTTMLFQCFLILLMLANIHVIVCAHSPMPGVDKYQCLVCLNQSANCSLDVASACGLCEPYVETGLQSYECNHVGCEACFETATANDPICSQDGIKFACNISQPLGGSDRFQSTMFRASSDCVWRANADSDVVIPLRSVRPKPAGWADVKHGASLGLVYKGADVVKPKEKDTFCLTANAEQKGSYAISVVSYAPKGESEGGFLWIRSKNGIFKISNFSSSGGGANWMRAKMNNGGWSDLVRESPFTKDLFFVRNVEAGENISVCFAAMSKSFEIYSVVLTWCDTPACIRNIVAPSRKSPVSKCL